MDEAVQIYFTSYFHYLDSRRYSFSKIIRVQSHASQKAIKLPESLRPLFLASRSCLVDSKAVFLYIFETRTPLDKWC